MTPTTSIVRDRCGIERFKQSKTTLGIFQIPKQKCAAQVALRPVSTTSVEKIILRLFYWFFFALASILTARFNRRSIKERKNALFHARSGNGPLQCEASAIFEKILRLKARLQPFTVLFSFSAILVCFIDAQIHSCFREKMSEFERQ